MNGRNYIRVNHCLNASISYGSNVAICNTDNLSLQGMYLKTEKEIPLNTLVDVTLYDSSHSSIEFNAKIVRKGKDGIGLQINKLNATSFVRLRDIIAKRCGSYGKLINETLTMTRCIC